MNAPQNRNSNLFANLCGIGCLAISSLIPVSTLAQTENSMQLQQKTQDLAVMTGFLERHPIVLEQVKLVDMLTFAIYFGADCRVFFTHASDNQADPDEIKALQFDHANCSLTSRESFDYHDQTIITEEPNPLIKP